MLQQRKQHHAGGGKRPRRRPTLRWMDRVRSDMKEHQLEDTKLALSTKSWRDRSTPDSDTIGKGEQVFALTSFVRAYSLVGQLCFRITHGLGAS